MVEQKATDRAQREEDLDRVFHALSAQPRRQIIEILRESGELRVSDIAKAFSMSLNGVSKHLKVLERAGLVRRRVEWREHFITVEEGAFAAPLSWLRFQEHFWQARLDALAEHFGAPTEDEREDDDERNES